MSDKTDFSKKLKKLEDIVEWFESEDIDLDKAVDKFEDGMKLAGELKKYLETVENRVEKVKKSFAEES